MSEKCSILSIFPVKLPLGKRINRLREELNRLLSKGMSNIYLKVTIEKN